MASFEYNVEKNDAEGPKIGIPSTNKDIFGHNYLKN